MPVYLQIPWLGLGLALISPQKCDVDKRKSKTATTGSISVKRDSIHKQGIDENNTRLKFDELEEPIQWKKT
jgi:hypothetical protein